MVTTPFPEGEPPPYGTVVDERTYAPIHQHFIVARLDIDVDGEPNTVVATETVQPPIGPDNPYGLALIQAQRAAAHRAEGGFRTTTGPPSAPGRSSTAPGATPSARRSAYKLVPPGPFPAMLDPSSPVFERAQVIGHTLWVTPFHPDERWPCGEFVNQTAYDEGLAGVDAGADRPIEDTDVVLWYVFGIHHVHARGGLAGDAGRHRVVLAQAVRVLRPQPGAGRRAPGLGARSGPLRTMSRYGPQFGPDITFLGVPRCTWDEPGTYADADVVILGAPFDGGTSHRPGTRFGPQAHPADLLPAPRRVAAVAGAARRRPASDLTVLDAGDVEMFSGDVERSVRDLQAAVDTVAAAGADPAGPRRRPHDRLAGRRRASPSTWARAASR